jgi:hypothetical protein
MSTPGRGKGSLLIHMRNYVHKTRGERAWTDVLERVGARDREVLRGVILAGGWYPIGVVNRTVSAVLGLTGGRAEDDEMRQLAAYIADSDLGSVYKMVLRLGSPDFLLRRTDSLWNRYFDVGKLTPTEVGPRNWKLTLAMETGDELAPNHYFCGPGCPSWIEMGLKMTGATKASVRHVECRLQNRANCTYVVTW